MREQLAVGIEQPSVGGGDAPAAGEHGAFGAHLAGRVGQRTYEIDLEFEREKFVQQIQQPEANEGVLRFLENFKDYPPAES